MFRGLFRIVSRYDDRNIDLLWYTNHVWSSQAIRMIKERLSVALTQLQRYQSLTLSHQVYEHDAGVYQHLHHIKIHEECTAC